MQLLRHRAFAPLLRSRALLVGVAVACVSAGALALAQPAGAMPGPGPSFLSQFSTVRNIASTVPPLGDVNPYGIVVAPQTVGNLVRGDTLVSNFNNGTNAEGTGTTIVQVSPKGAVTVFAQLTSLPGRCPGGIGLTTALATLPGGFVVVGSLPTSDGTSATAQSGCLIVLNSVGQPVEVWSGHGINGPWDMTAVSTRHFALLFVTNVLNGTVTNSPNVVSRGTVVRLLVVLHGQQAPTLAASTVIGRGFDERTDPAALVVGPTGVALGPEGQLYVADTTNSRIAVIPDVLFRSSAEGHGGITVSSGGSLNGPLGLIVAPNGDILTVNAGDGNIVETTPQGAQIDTVQIDPAGAGGDLFGLTLAPHDRGVLFVDDGDNTLKVFTRGH